jgi:hypothetical protein
MEATMTNLERDQSGDEGGNAGHGGEPGHQPDSVTIVVNGRAKTVPKNAILSYWDVVNLAFDNPQTGDGIQYTVQYTRGQGNKPSGTLVEGQSVKVKEGMEFDVTSTNRS